MKKLICLLSALAMLTCAVSCGDDEDDGSSRKKSSKSSVSDNDETEEETTKRVRKKKASEEDTEPETEEETEEETTEPETKPASKTNNWQLAYENKLMEVYNSPDFVSDWDSGTEFSLEDLDSDGTPELILSYNYSDPVEVYTCTGDDTVYIGRIGNYGEVGYVPEKHIFVSSDYDSTVRISTNNYMVFSGGELLTVCSVGVEYNELGELFNWYVNDECTTEEDYNEMVDLYDGGRVQLGREFRFNEMQLALYGSGSWEQTYSDLLTEIVENRYDDTTYPTFSIYDVTGDGVPELFVSGGWYHIANVDIYTYDGRLIKIGGAGSYGSTSYNVENETISSEYMSWGYESGADYEIRDNRLVQVFSYQNNCGSVENESEYEFKLNGHKATQEEYEKAIAAHQSQHYVWLGNDDELNAETALDVADGKYTEPTIHEFTVQ